MAAFLPIAIVATLLTSGVAIRAHHAPPAGSGGRAGSVIRIDARADAAALEVSRDRSESSRDKAVETTTNRDGPAA
jgi:hypothetical protein